MEQKQSAISFSDVSFQYYGQESGSIRNINLSISHGEFVVLTGQSGCGKTTLTRCVNGLIPHFFEGTLTGTVTVLGKEIQETSVGELGKAVASIFQDPRSQFFTTDSSCEAAFACENYGVPHHEMIYRVEEAFWDLGMENLRRRSIFELSSGERQKVAFVAATTLNPRIYVLDEPSANLDIGAIFQMRIILQKLKAEGHTILISEHRLFYLHDLADHFILIQDGQIAQEFTDAQLAALSPQELHAKRLRTMDLSKLIPDLKINTLLESPPLLQIRDLNFHHKGMPELLHHLFFSGNSGETVAFIGENGCGKTTLGKIIAGLIRCNDGTFSIKGRPIRQKRLSDYVYFVMQEADHQLYTDSVEAELLLGNTNNTDISNEIDEVLKLLNLEQFRKNHPYALSGGQKQRVTIATAMVSQKPIVVLDEPTSGLDWNNMKAVAKAVNTMRDSGRLVILISHDLEFLSLTTQRALLLEDGKIQSDIQIRDLDDVQVIHTFMTLHHHATKGGKKDASSSRK